MTRWTAAHSAALVGQRVLGVNFHHVAAGNRAEVAVRLRRAAGLGIPLDPADLAARDGVPRIFVAFYDGYRDTGLFGAELCADLGIRAFFFPVFVDPDPVGSRSSGPAGPARAGLTDDDLAQIATVHELGFHSSSHVAAAEVTPATLDREVREPVERIRALAGRPPRIGAWRGGARFDDQTLGDRTLRDLGLRCLVSNWSVEPVPPAGASGSP